MASFLLSLSIFLAISALFNSIIVTSVSAINPLLTVDTYGLRFNSSSSATNLTFNFIDDECYHCKPLQIASISDDKKSIPTDYFTLDCEYGSTITAVGLIEPHGELHELASFHQHFGERGMFTLTLDENNSFTLTVEDEPDNRYEPLYIAVGIMFALTISYAIANHYGLFTKALALLFYHFSAKGDAGEELLRGNEGGGRGGGGGGGDAPGGDAAKKQVKGAGGGKRVLSLDTFRGISLCIMIFVNYGGGSYYFFQHSKWNGLTVADLVFPWFIWMMGVSMPISFNSLMKKQGKSEIIYKILKRTVILWVLGVMVSNTGFVNYKEIRLFGVLQRFSISFLVCSILIVFVPKHQSRLKNEEEEEDEERSSRCRSILSEHLKHIYEYLIVFFILFLHTCITFLLDVPGCGRGYLGPGGLLGDNGEYVNCTGGAAGYVDRQILGLAHNFYGCTAKDLYKLQVPYDPEGILGCLTSIGMTYFGVLAGRVLLTHQAHAARLKRWIVYGLVTGTIAMILCGGKQNGGVIPINKNMWSLSFILALSSCAYLLLSLLYVIIDIKRWWAGAPFIYMGMNSIVIYCGSEFLQSVFPFSWEMTDANATGMQVTTHEMYIWQDIWAVSLWLTIAWYMQHIGFFVSI